jgi:hypothetical protein
MQTIAIWPYTLCKGHSIDPAKGACAMAAISWLVHGKHSDAPECACPIITAYVIPANDKMPDDVRQRLLPYLHRISGSRSEAHQAARARIFQLSALRIFAPRALDAAGLHEHAERLRSLPSDVDMKTAATAAYAAANAAAYAAATAAYAAANAADAAYAAADAAYAAYAAYAAADAAYAAANAAANAADAAYAAANAAAYAANAADAADVGWDDYFAMLNQALRAGPEGTPWSVDIVNAAEASFISAGGVGVPCRAT